VNLVFIWKNYKKESSTIKGLHAFLSMSELTMRSLFPVNLKIYLKIHENLPQLEGVTRVELPKEIQEETLFRITHLHEAAKFVEQELESV